MLATLTIIRYPKRYIPFALVAMAIHRIPCWLNKNISFYKLMGSGRNGSFDKNPDWQQWGIFTVTNSFQPTEFYSPEKLIHLLYGSFISKWFNFFKCETWTVLLEPIEGHGSWDGTEPFGKLPKQTDYEGLVAILTRATIRLSKLKAFWKNVDAVSIQMNTAEGFISSVGIGEIPLIKQATFSIWKNKNAMKAFAYSLSAHTTVIQKTRKENWYSEEMFIRFKPIMAVGTIKGFNPLEGKL